MTHRKSCISRGCRHGCDAWNHRVRDSGVFKSLAFFASAAKDEGISAFQSNDGEPSLSPVNQDGFNVPLGQAGMASFFSDINAFSFRWSMPKKVRVGKMIVENNISLFQGLFPPEGQESRISGTRSDQGHVPLDGGSRL